MIGLYMWGSTNYEVYPENLDQMKAENPISQVVALDPSLLPLNQEQRKLYDTVGNQYSRELALNRPPPPQLLLNVDGVAGSGKAFTLLKTCARIQELATEAEKQNPIFRAGPTGIAAFNIVGKTLQSLLRFPVKTLQALQCLFRDCTFITDTSRSCQQRSKSTVAFGIRLLHRMHVQNHDEKFHGIVSRHCA